MAQGWWPASIHLFAPLEILGQNETSCVAEMPPFVKVSGRSPLHRRLARQAILTLIRQLI